MADVNLQLDGQNAALSQHNDALRQLVSEHHALDAHLRQLSTLAHLSLDEQYEEAALKKRKLALKDRIEATVRGQARPASSA